MFTYITTQLVAEIKDSRRVKTFSPLRANLGVISLFIYMKCFSLINTFRQSLLPNLITGSNSLGKGVCVRAGRGFEEGRKTTVICQNSIGECLRVPNYFLKVPLRILIWLHFNVQEF